MGDGWETKRRRDNGNDWAMIKLGVRGSIRKVIVDTAHFKGQLPDPDAVRSSLPPQWTVPDADTKWQEVIGETPLYADHPNICLLTR